MFISGYTEDEIKVKCIPENKFENVEWPTCVKSKFVFDAGSSLFTKPVFHD